MKYLISNQKTLLPPKDWPVPTKIQKIGVLNVLLEEERNIEVIRKCLLLHDGYLRDLDEKIDDLAGQLRSVTKAIGGEWPLASNYTGSFSAALIDSEEQKIVLCTDQVGLYPLYYLRKSGLFYISNSIILIGAISGCDFDEAGIVQRCLGPELENIGSRTILKNCKRLLPGECLRFDFEGNILSREYDNRLYNDISDPSQDHDLAKEYWRAYQNEVKYCVNYSENVNIALSGGIDSRIVLGAIPDEKPPTCFTFGDPGNYESRVAWRLAKIKKAKFVACHDSSVYFPKPETLKRYTLQTEAVQLCSWLEITEKVGEPKKEPLLFGELCEALPARKIEKFSSRKFRQENFYKYYIRGKDYEFEKVNEKNVSEWKEKIRKRFRIYYHERNLVKIKVKSGQEQLITALNTNLEEIFSRIDAHNLPYIELYDELFSWYTYTRMRLSKQLLLSGSKFDSYSPAMSLQLLTRTSNLHPNLRLNYRFAKKLFRNHKELKKLNRVPTSQAPLIPQNFPDLLKFAMWGFRSKADQVITKRLMKTRDISKPYRLFRSINWAKVYQHPDMEKNLKAYFDPNHLGEAYFKDIYAQAIERKALKQWPFANMNIMNAASLNTELKLINDFKKG
ncbi:hypothetical protein [Salinimicrobium gaetbulicola]|uniref:asparagine synthase (glutamine-hydrolyzing) n=1 Tax=Salinimicrobium gaetbulicola TaxID=999702 RepID=A0ABW3IJ99_9FLAO